MKEKEKLPIRIVAQCSDCNWKTDVETDHGVYSIEKGMEYVEEVAKAHEHIFLHIVEIKMK